MNLRSGKIFNVLGHTRLKSVRILIVMTNPKNTFRARNDTSDFEPPVTTIVSMIRTINTNRVTCPILTQVSTSVSMPGVVVTFP